MSTQQTLWSLAPPARVYGVVTEPERQTIRRRSGGQREAVMAWFDAHPGEAISADRLAKILGLPCERGVASRCSELASDKERWLTKSEKRVAGPRGIKVHEYRRSETR